MSFKITRAIGAIGILSCLVWLSIHFLTPVEHECQVEYYGTPDFQALASDVLDIQASSYHYDNNYHRALRSQECLNTRFDCDVINRIDYLGGRLIENQISREEAIEIVQYQIEEIYKQNGLAELRLNWTIPIIIGGEFDYPTPDFEIDGYQNCTTTIELRNDLPLEAGQFVTCYVPPLGSECRADLERHVNLDNVASVGAYMAAFSLLFVTCVTILALAVRCKKRIRKLSSNNSDECDDADAMTEGSETEEEFADDDSDASDDD